MDNYTNNINIQDILGSIQVLDNLMSTISTKDFNSYFYDLEEIIKKINFEHGNCISNYKDDLAYIMDEIESCKMKVYHLTEAMKETCTKFENKDELNNQDLGELSSLYNGSINRLNVSDTVNTHLVHNSDGAVQLRNATSQTNMLENNIVNYNDNTTTSGIYKIPPIDQNSTEQTTVVNQPEEINTIPIGLGIAATGISASVGAVIVDDMKTKSKVKLDEYREDDNTKTNTKANSSDSRYYSFGKEVLESNDQYQASRNRKSMDKFYGENNEYYEDED